MEDQWLKEEEKEFKRFYRFSLWWVNHRRLLRRSGLGVLFVIEVIATAVLVFLLVDLYVLTPEREHSQLNLLVHGGQQDLNAYTQSQRARDLDVGTSSVFSLGSGRYDLFTTMVNPNDDWYATFSYRFSSATVDSPVEEGFILPNEEKPFAAFAVESSVPPRGITFELIDLSWHRVDHHVVGDVETWSADRLAFEIVDVSVSQEEVVEGETLARTTFTVRNNTGFSYWEPTFFLLLKRGARVVGVNRTTLSELDAGDEAQVVVNWFGSTPQAGQVEIVPEVNILSLESYKELEGETTIDTRARVFQSRR